MVFTKEFHMKKNSQKKTPEGYIQIPENASDLLKEAINAFNMGNFYKTRKLSVQLLKSNSEQDQNFAKRLLDMTSVDKTVLYLALFSVLVLVFIFIWAVKISH